MTEAAVEQVVEEAPAEISSEQKAPENIWSQGEAPKEAQDQAPAEAPAGSDWYFDEDIPGKGDKPEWMKEKYKTVSDQAKAYVELEKRMGEVAGSPKDGYNYEGIEGLSGDDPMVSHFANTFKELNLSQKGFERVINEFVGMQSESMQVNAEAEVKKLGVDGAIQVERINTWLGNTFDDATAQTIKGWVSTAEDIKALQSLKSFQPQSSIPSAQTAQMSAGYETVKELRNEQATSWDKYQADPNYRARWQERLRNAHGRETAGKK